MKENSFNEWKSIRLKYMATINDETLPENTNADFEIDYMDIGNVNSNGVVEPPTTYRFEDAPSRARRKVKNGDIIISTVRTYLQAIAPIENPSENLIVSTGFAVVRPLPEKMDARFCKYALREISFLSEVVMRSVGVSYPAINSSDLGNIFIKAPIPSIQSQIAAFLDHETARIDTLVAAKERQLALLTEKRRTIITKLVTRGLDSMVKLKDSGVEWLGEVPEKWEVKSLKYAAILKSGENLKSEDMSEDGEFLVYGGNGYRGLYHEYNHEGHYVLIGRQGALCGNINYAEGKFWATEHAVVVSIIDGSNTIYLGELLRIMNLNQYSVSAAQPGLSVEVISNLKIPSPPISEQNEIVASLQKETFTLDALQAATNRSIGLLKERRAALISAAVTGQIEIQNYEN